MANANAPFGLKPIRHGASAPYNDGTDEFYVPASDANAMYIGDPVVISGTASPDGVPSVALATAGAAGRITGVIVGFRPTPGIVANGFRAASTEAWPLVEHDPASLYEIQEDSVGGALAVTDIGLNADLIAGAGGNAFKRSGWMLDTSTKATTATLQVRIRGFAQRPDVEIGVNSVVLVSINLPTETGAAGSTGV